MDYKTLRKRALLCDIVCIIVAAAVLYVGSNYHIAPWIAIVGLIVALAALVLALRYSRQSRQLERAALEQQAGHAQAEKPAEAETGKEGADA